MAFDEIKEPIGMHPLEYISDSAVATNTILSEHALKAHFQDELHLLRLGVQLYLKQIDALGTNGGIAFFRFGEESESDTLTIESEQNQDALLLFRPGTSRDSHGRFTGPYIRLIRSEAVRVFDGFEYITRDYCVDEDGDPFFNFGAFPIREEAPYAIPTVPIAITDEEGSISIKFHDYYPTITELRHEDTQILPYGFFEILGSKIDTVAEIKRAFSVIATHEPRCISKLN